MNNHSIIERCPHDRENPYVMISREMAQDKSISPKAKGVLLYLLSLPKDWKIYHSQLQEGLGVGEEYLNSSLEELISSGYAERTRKRVKGIYQPYHYKIREFKKCLPNRENQPGFSSPENPVLQSKDGESKDIQKKQLLKDPPDPKPKNSVVIVPSLQKLDISERLRKEISSNHPKDKIDKAVEHCLKWKGRSNDQVGIMLILQRFDEWKDVIQQEDVKAKNSEFLNTLKHLDDKKIENTMIVVGNSYIEFVLGHNLTRFEISNKDFISQVNEYLSKLKNRKGLS